MAVSILVFILVVIFGSSSWIGTNSVWMQLPLLTADLPEAWNLPSYLSCVVQIGCIGPLVYGIIHKCFPKLPLPTVPLISFFLFMACACQLGLVFLWKITATIAAKEYSVALYSLIFGLAIVNSISNVLFLPFMAQFHLAYLNAYFVGMGFSALVPSLLSLIQGIGKYDCVIEDGKKLPLYYPPRFSVSTFFLLIFFWTVLATASFLILYRMGAHKRQEEEEAHEETPLSRSGSVSEMQINDSPENRDTKNRKNDAELSMITIAFILIGTALINAQMNGIITSVQSYATLPYSQSTYHYSVVFANVVSPIASFLPFFFTIRSYPILVVLTLLSSLITGFIVYLAALSPGLIFNSITGGSVVAITSSLIAAGIHSYLRIVFASLLREGNKSENQLFWCGIFIQIGSFLGTAVMFPLVNIFNVFTPAPVCSS